MPVTRRPQLDDRRRMVIYSQRLAEDEESPAVRARLDATARQARRPVAAYGWRVQRRLRSRWYGIVPVRRRAMLGVTLGVLAIVGALAVGHWAALWWEPIATRPDVARALRLDRPDSFGTWLGSVLLMLAAGASFLVYQLRRYRTDDYHGHYRLWRIAILVCVAASVDSVTHVMGTVGAMVDVLLAERDVLAGADWVRLVVGIGGAAFGLRMVGELSRSRVAAAAMSFALAMLAVSPAVRWNVMRMEPISAVLWVPMATLLGRATLMLSAVLYLRALYREVRKIERGDRFADRLRRLVPRWQRDRPPLDASPARKKKGGGGRFAAAGTESAAVAEDDLAEGKTASRKWLAFGRRRAEKIEAEKKGDGSRSEVPESASAAESESDEPEGKTAGRKWLSFGRRRAAAREEDNDVNSVETSNVQDSPPQTKRSRFAFGRRKITAEKDDSTTTEDKASKDDPAPPRPKRSLFGFGRRKGSVEVEEAGGEDDADTTNIGLHERKNVSPAAKQPPRPTSNTPAPRAPVSAARVDAADDGEDGEEMVDDGTVDWEGMSKAERRRKRKLIKRQDRAA